MTGVVCAAALIAAGRYSSFLNITVSISGQNGNAAAAEPAKAASEAVEPGKTAPEAAKPAAAGEPATVELNEKQLGQIKIEPASRQTFLVQKSMVGGIDFNEDLLVQVFTPYQGRLVTVNGNIGDAVKAGQVLFTIDSYDLLQAEST
ncbi:MAG: efflux RND transporter periplasmic adaptor subunit, partial [Beijerinckiaceae bacterium]|nr:efflux RND transporter periplasmic adaptor subunit [Beijerinckiaceae bacterium]